MSGSAQNKMPRIKVRIPYPNHADICPAVKESVRKLRECQHLNVDVGYVQGASISILRNAAVNNNASEKTHQTDFDFDFFLSVDSDVEFSPEDVAALVNRGVDVVSGAYQHRKDKSVMVAGMYSGTPGLVVANASFLPWHLTGLRAVDWVGAGFLLVRREVFERMAYPWFSEVVVTHHVDGVSYSPWAGEDVGFCLTAQKAGFKIYVDCDIKVNHLTLPPFVVGEENINQCRREVMEGEKKKLQDILEMRKANLAELTNNITAGRQQLAEMESKAFELRGAIRQLTELLDERKG